jgi:hypothetical protein
VKSFTADTSAPVILDLSISEDTVDNLSTMSVTVILDTNDVTKITVRFDHEDENRDELIHFTSMDTIIQNSDNSFTLVKTIDEFIVGGKYKFSNMLTQDTVGNFLWQQPSWAQEYYIYVIGSNTDTTCPELIDIDFVYDTVSDKDSLRLYLKAKDDNAGIAEIYMNAESEYGNQTFTTKYNYTGYTTYDWRILDSVTYYKANALPYYAAYGKWNVKYIYFRDQAWNYCKVVPSDTMENCFFYENSTPDTLPPSLNSLVFSNDSFVGDTVDVFVNITDDFSGIKSFTLSFNRPDGTTLNISKDAGDWTNLAGGNFRARIVTNQIRAGFYNITEFQLIDSADNTIELSTTELPTKQFELEYKDSVLLFGRVLDNSGFYSSNMNAYLFRTDLKDTLVILDSIKVDLNGNYSLYTNHSMVGIMVVPLPAEENLAINTYYEHSPTSYQAQTILIDYNQSGSSRHIDDISLISIYERDNYENKISGVLYTDNTLTEVIENARVLLMSDDYSWPSCFGEDTTNNNGEFSFSGFEDNSYYNIFVDIPGVKTFADPPTLNYYERLNLVNVKLYIENDSLKMISDVGIIPLTDDNYPSSLFPNIISPGEKLYIDSEYKTGMVEIYSSKGELVSSEQVFNNSNYVIIPNISSGVYIIRINGYSEKIIVK